MSASARAGGVDVAVLARQLGVHARTVWRWGRERRIELERDPHSRRVRVARADADRLRGAIAPTNPVTNAGNPASSRHGLRGVIRT